MYKVLKPPLQLRYRWREKNGQKKRCRWVLSPQSFLVSVVDSSLCPQSSATTDLFSVPIYLSFHQCLLIEVRQWVAFWVRLFQLKSRVLESHLSCVYLQFVPFYCDGIVFHRRDVWQYIYVFTAWWTFGLFLNFGDHE